ncbi:MAG TPA: hypothetical protein PLP48_06710 [Acholeplasmataceae bacterium]|nr:hypothetical protein [Acholeplasmataceae bacterium]
MKKTMVVIGLIGLLVIGFIAGRYIQVSQQNDVFELESSTQVELLNYEVQELEETFEGSEDLALFLDLHRQLIEIHQELVIKHQTLKSVRESVQQERLAFKELNVRLSVEDGIALWTNYNALLDIKDAFVATEGQAYQRLADLKDQYDIEHIELILQTYQEVLVVLNQREAMIDQAIELFNESLVIYQNYTHM